MFYIMQQFELWMVTGFQKHNVYNQSVSIPCVYVFTDWYGAVNVRGLDERRKRIEINRAFNRAKRTAVGGYFIGFAVGELFLW